MKLAELQELEARWVMQTYSRTPVEFVRGEGARLWDSDGNQYLDFLAGISVCSGGIIGLGESLDDRCQLLITLANQEAHPESVPINALVPVEGTPLSGLWSATTLDGGRAPAAARLLQRFVTTAAATNAMVSASGSRGLSRRGNKFHVALWS